jgi:FkbM family methyltransferase
MDQPPFQQLESLLGKDVSETSRDEQTAFDRLVTPASGPVVLFGAGNLGRKVLHCLRSDRIEPAAFSDNNPALWHTAVDGVEVLPPALAAARFGQQAAFIMTIWNPDARQGFAQTKQQLTRLGCSTVLPIVSLFWKYPTRFLPAMYFDLPHRVRAEKESIREAFEVWADDESQWHFVSQLQWRLEANSAGLPAPVQQEQYFPDDLFLLSDQESFVDCGAYDGDSIARFIQRKGDSFRCITAFEPDPLSFQRLSTYVSGLSAQSRSKVKLLPMAVGEHAGKVRFAVSGKPSSAISADGDYEVDLMPLDAVDFDAPPSYMKMDIEGAEPEAVNGAYSLIQRCQPVLAVCTYHRSAHLWQIPLLIRSICPDYRLYLRPHGHDGWDLVTYAVPRDNAM